MSNRGEVPPGVPASEVFLYSDRMLHETAKAFVDTAPSGSEKEERAKFMDKLVAFMLSPDAKPLRYLVRNYPENPPKAPPSAPATAMPVPPIAAEG